MANMWRDIVEGSGLTWYRAALCDLLTGRRLRHRAAEVLERALWCESQGIPFDYHLASAAHLEWIAMHAERGQILWGGRFNRDAKRPEI
jgi:hypothetical protein